MAAPRTQKRASANAGRTAASQKSASRASTSRTTSTRAKRSASRRTPPSRKARAKLTSGQARVTTLVVIAAIVLAAWSVYPVFRLQYEQQRELESLESELEGLKSRNQELRNEVDELKTPEGVEQLARETLGFVKPGEQAYVVTGGTISDTSATALPTEGSESPFWQRTLDTLFGLE